MTKKAVLVWQLTDRGFCSELNTMLFALLYSKQQGFDFALSSNHWNAAFEHGWQDYFNPFASEVCHPSLAVNLLFVDPTLRVRLSRFRTRRRVAWSLKRRVYLNFDVWGHVYNESFLRGCFRLPGVESEVDAFTALSALANSVWKMKVETSSAIHQYQRQLGLGKSYFTLFIRRGDKSTEAAPIPVQKYLELAVRRGANEIRDAFILTDDYSVVEELEALRTPWRFTTLCSRHSRGHEQASFNAQSREEKKNSTERFLSELEIAAAGEFLVGTYSSNVTRFLALLHGRERIVGVDKSFSLM